MNVLVACEESQRVCTEFRKLGHNAFSCDLVECSGGHPEWHIKQDVIPLLNGNCKFNTCDNKEHEIRGKWDMIIAFPPCTDLAVSGARHFEKKRINGSQEKSIIFFTKFLNADCDKIAIENPVGIISGNYIKTHFKDLAEKFSLPKKPTQIIQPYYFGDSSKKTTCLFLKNLNKLKPTKIVYPKLISYVCKNGKKVTFSEHMVKGFKQGERAKERSKTFPGIAKAMAEQWGNNL